LRLDNGRIAVRKVPFVRPSVDDLDAAATQAALDRWAAAVAEQDASVQRFTLRAGDLVVIDNYRVLHGREPFEGERVMWRVWVWTDEGHGVPAGALHSDTRYAATPAV
jgi:gamma-butyrobetaine dioxygenase